MNPMNHITFSVSDLEKSIVFYTDVLNAKLLVKRDNLAYFDLDGLWLALNVEKDIIREKVNVTYTHIAFSMDESDYEDIYDKLKRWDCILEGRERSELEKSSIYFHDPDGHRLEFHSGSLEDRLAFLKEK